ncbi:MAG TPA: hypothetical protein GXX34_00810 [Clostridia bacterium]|nr:hypothetical protein [Clostridia bacterium]
MKNISKVIGLLAALCWLLSGAAVSGAEVQVEVNHLTLSLTQAGDLLVRERYMLEAAGEGSLVLPLPANAVDVQPGEGMEETQVEVEEGKLILHLETAAGGGGQSVNFDYYIETAGGIPHFFWERDFFYDTPTFFVMVPAGQLRIVSDQLENQGVMPMGETSLVIYAGAFSAGDTLKMTVVPDTMGGENVPGTVERESVPPFHPAGHVQRWEESAFSGIEPHLFMVVVIGVPVGLLVWYLVKRRKEAVRAKTEAEREEEVFQRYLVREKFLKEKLLELEKKKAEGTIDDEDYAQQLELYKKKLLEVKAKLKQFTE